VRTKTAIVSFVLGVLSVISLTAAAGVVEGGGAPIPNLGNCNTDDVLPKTVRPPDVSTTHPGTGGVLEGTG
jgi:hypothetical protein